MVGHIALFELRYQLRRLIVLLGFLVAAAVGVLFITVSAKVAGATFVDAPASIARVLALFSLLALLLSLPVFADVALRDVETGMGPLIQTKPVHAALHVGGRFLGACLVACLLFIGLALGLLLGARMWWIAPEVVGPFRAEAYALALAVVALPNLLVVGALYFAVSTLTHSRLATYLAALAFLCVYVSTLALFGQLDYRQLAALADPFGITALMLDTRYWSSFEHNTRLPPLDGLLLWNRALWLAISAALLACSMAVFTRREQGRCTGGRAPAARSAGPVPLQKRLIAGTGGAGLVDQLVVRVRYELRTVLRSWTLLILLALGVLTCVLVLINPEQSHGTPSIPATAVVVEGAMSAYALLALAIPIIYSAELVWRDRLVRMAEIVDATPTPSLVFFLSKLFAVVVVLCIGLCVVTITAVAMQLIKGSTGLDLGLYVIMLFVLVGLPALMLGVLAFFIQTVVPHRHLGSLVVIMIVLAATFLPMLGVEDKLLHFAEIPEVPLSEMNRYGHYLEPALWFVAYWGCITVLFGIAAHLLWARGISVPLIARLKRVRGAISPLVAGLAVMALAGSAATGGYIYWNTRVLNEFNETASRERLAADYERAYRKFENLPQPRVSAVESSIDLFPDRRGFVSRGQYVLTNRDRDQIDVVRVQFSLDVKVDKVALKGGELIEKAERFNHFVFRARTPWAFGEDRLLTYAITAKNRGFKHGPDASPVVYNGSFANNTDLAPVIGVQRGFYLQATSRRRELGLPPLEGMARQDDKLQRQRNYISADADFIRFSATVSTTADQLALAPGNLEREWTEAGRRFFRYSLDTPVLNFWSIVSGRYAVARDAWQGVELAVYHHPSHGRNAARMLDAMKHALAYYTEKFGPFPHRHLRIVEFPKYFKFAQSFPTLIPYSEGFGFLADLSHPDSIDYVWNVTAHEVAHQWWAHQVIGANVQGATMLSEALAEYSALMVMERRYGPHKMRRYLKHELDTYLSSRGRSAREKPLASVESHQTHIHYQKGALAMYAPQGGDRRGRGEPRACESCPPLFLQVGSLSDIARPCCAAARRGGCGTSGTHFGSSRKDRVL